MNIYAFIPLVATIAYIPLLVTTISAQPWRRQHKLFILFLVAAVVWSQTDYISRSNFFPQYSLLLIKILLIILVWTAVQFHCFTSSFFPADKGRWLPFAYGSLGVDIILVALGYLPREFITIGDSVHPQYGISIVVVVIPLLALLARNMYILVPRLRNQDNPIIYNQTVSLLLTLMVLAVFTLTALLPASREIPIPHLGNIIIAIILSYAVVGHQLVDIRSVLRRGLIWVSIGIVKLSWPECSLAAFSRLNCHPCPLPECLPSAFAGPWLRLEESNQARRPSEAQAMLKYASQRIFSLSYTIPSLPPGFWSGDERIARNHVTQRKCGSLGDANARHGQYAAGSIISPEMPLARPSAIKRSDFGLVRSLPLSRTRVTPKASAIRPGPLVSFFRSRGPAMDTPRATAISSRPTSGSSARNRMAPAVPFGLQVTFRQKWLP